MHSELVDDLGLSKWKTVDFWAMIALLLAMFWFRMFVHFVAQYLWLAGSRVPVIKFEATSFSVCMSQLFSVLFFCD